MPEEEYNRAREEFYRRRRTGQATVLRRPGAPILEPDGAQEGYNFGASLRRSPLDLFNEFCFIICFSHF